MKKQALVGLSALLLLCGCSRTTSVSNASDAIMTIGDTTYTKEDEYNLLKAQSGASMSVELIRQYILDEEIGRTKEIKEAANEEYASYEETTENLEEQLKDAGYKNKKAYINKVLIPNAQTDKLLEKYFTDAKSEIKKTYKPSLAKILVCDDEKTAKKALKALKDGTDVQEVYDQYASEDASYTNEEVLITTENTDLPTRLINKLYKQEKAGVVNEVFTNEDNSTDSTAYVAILVNNTYKDIKDQVKESLSSNSEISTNMLVFYLKKYNFEVHDQDIFDNLKTNNPEYLINHPELSEDED